MAARLVLLEDMPSLADVFKDPDLRARFDAVMAGDPNYRAPRTGTQEESVPGRHGPVRVRIYSPIQSPAALRPGLLWLHGGGFILGDLDMPEADTVARELSDRANATVVSVEYSLAVNGVHYPIPHDDVVDAWRWVVANARRLDVDATRLSLGGASAGANLATGAALRLRDEHDTPQARQLLLAYPTLHAVLPRASAELTAKMAEVPRVFRFLPDERSALTSNYLGGATDPIPGYAMPAEANLTGLPPVLMITSEYDDLRASGEAFAAQLEQAGVTTNLTMAAGMLHGHLNLQPTIPEVDRSLQLFADALKRS
jgi:acetyl esterase/lipase